MRIFNAIKRIIQNRRLERKIELLERYIDVLIQLIILYQELSDVIQDNIIINTLDLTTAYDNKFYDMLMNGDFLNYVKTS